MPAGTKVTIAIIVLFGAVLGLYYGFAGPDQAPAGAEQPYDPSPADYGEQVAQAEAPGSDPTGDDFGSASILAEPVGQALGRAAAEPAAPGATDREPSAGGGGDTKRSPWVLRAPDVLDEPPPTPAAVDPANGYAEYVVREDDSLWTIADRQLGDATLWRRIAELNPALDPDRLRVGQRLLLPGSGNGAGLRLNGEASVGATASPTQPRPAPAASSRHTVRSGETLSSIAERYYGDATKWRRIWSANRDVCRDPDRLRVGMRLRIPGTG